MAANERQVFMVTAAKRHGKSTTVRSIAEAMDKNILVYKQGSKINDPAFIGYPVMPLSKYTGGKAIIDGGRIEYEDFLRQVYKYFRNGVVVIDDAAHYETNDPSKPLKRILIDCRSLGIDVIMVFHSLEDTPVRLFGYTDLLILGYCGGNFEYKLRKLPEGTEITEASRDIKAIVRACRCESQKPCKCGRRYVRRVIKLT
ncbi:MAG TPA: hypothetical protein VL098_12560 [Flavipsychrobacter sp.]|nr:hypothetical protein [Flavipsychrobacter sp.]